MKNKTQPNKTEGKGHDQKVHSKTDYLKVGKDIHFCL